MRFDVFTIIPGVLEAYLQASVLGKAQQAGLVEMHLHDIRDHTSDRHRTTDDTPYGGGGGMIMKPEPIFAAVEAVLGSDLESTPVILLTPQGRVLTQDVARELSLAGRLTLLCGRYEGIDERVREHLVTDEISIGDYVLTGGELPALVLIDAITRLIPGVLGDSSAVENDSHSNALLEHPQYTRPAVFRGWSVPEVLRSGDHARVDAWRRQESLRRTFRRRPDMLKHALLSRDDEEFIAGLAEQEGLDEGA